MAVSVKYDNYADVLYVKRIGRKYKASSSIDDDDASIYLDFDTDNNICGFVCISPGQEAFESIKRNADKIPCDMYNAYAILYWVHCVLVRRGISESLR